MLRFCIGFRFSFPYNKNLLNHALSGTIFSFLRIGSMVSNNFSLEVLNSGHNSKKCTVDSDPLPHIHASLGVSLNLCLCLWAFSALKPPLSWNKYLRLGLCMLKMLFFSGLIIPTIFCLNKHSFMVRPLILY